MNKIIKPGFLKNGKECKICIKLLSNKGNYCKRKGHSIKRIISISNEERKNVDYNFAELLVAVCLKCDNIQEHLKTMMKTKTKLIECIRKN